MFCEKCGRQINPGAAFCPACGAAVNGAPSENKLKSTFKGSMANPTQTAQYNNSQDYYASAPSKAPELEYPTQPVQSAPQPVYQMQNPNAAYNETPPAYTPPTPTTGTHGAGSGKVVNNGKERTVLSVVAVLFAMFLPIFASGFFPGDYALGFEVLENVFSNFDYYMEIAEATDDYTIFVELLIYLIPFGMLLCSLLKSRIGNLLLAAVGVGCCTYRFTRVFFEWLSIDADISFFDCSGLSFGFYLLFVAFIMSSAKSKQD